MYRYLTGGLILSVVAVSASQEEEDQNVENTNESGEKVVVLPKSLIEMFEKVTEQHNELMDIYNEIHRDIETLRNEEGNIVNNIIRYYHILKSDLIKEMDKEHEDSIKKLQQTLEENYTEAVSKFRTEEKAKLLDLLDESTTSVCNSTNNVIKSGEEAYKEITHIYILAKYFHEKNKRQQSLAAITSRFLLLRQRIAEHPTLPFDAYLNLLDEVTKSTPTIHQNLSLIPKSVAISGIPSLVQLRSDFENSVRKSKSVCFAGKDANVLDYAIGYVKQFLPFNSDDKGLFILSRAQNYMERDQLKLCLAELKQLKGEPREMMENWINKAEESIILHDSLDSISKDISNQLKELINEEPPKRDDIKL